MTDFEAATVAYQTASLAMQQAQMWSAYAQAGGALLVGGAQCLLIYFGLVTHIPLPTLLLRHKRFPPPLLGGVPRSGGVGFFLPHPLVDRGAMNTFEFWSLVTYFSQLGAIVWGIWTMKHASDLRDRVHERRHTESMTALRTLIEHGDESRQALRALLERSQERQ